MKKILFPAFALILSFSIAFWALQGNLFEVLDLSVSSFLYKENTAAPTGQVVLVTIDDRTLSDEEGLGRWENFKRGYYGTVLDKLARDGALVIGMDILFAEQSGDQEEDEKLAATLKKYSNIVLAGFYRSDKTIDPTSQLKDHALVGNVFVAPDKDNVMRRIPIVHSGKEALALVMMKRLLNSGPELPPSAVAENKIIVSRTPIRIAELRVPPVIIPVDDRNQMLLNFFRQENQSFEKISFVDVYRGNFPPGTFQDKLVLIGGDAVGLAVGIYDKQYIPLSYGEPVAGVEIHAHALETMLQGRYLTPVSESTLFWLIMAIIAVNTLIFFWLSVPLAIGIVLIELFAYLTTTFFLFSRGTLAGVSYPVFAILLSFVISILLKLVLEQKSKRFISKAFAQYLSPQVLQKIMKNPEALKLGGEKKDISVFFSDIEGFTTISEKFDAETVVHFLNEYFTEITNLILANQGTIDKFEGDAVMSFFGAPVEDPFHAFHAVNSALLCQKRLQFLQEKWIGMGFNVHTRIGINSGEAVVGNIGSKDHFDYTVIGDTVNLASRLENVNKFYKTSIIISEYTYQRLVSPANKDTVSPFFFRPLDLIRVMGKLQPVQILEVLGFREEVSSATKMMVAAFQQAWQQYHEGDFAAAKKKFERLAQEYQDPVSQVFAERCEELLKNKPAHWDGVFVMASK